ncbi:MAG: hypothetical protein JJW03_07325 [Desulfosarcina sp.]|nr:hypothetical protein [Desulfobacterales bacterium]
MKKIRIKTEPANFDFRLVDYLVDYLGRLFPECDIEVVSDCLKNTDGYAKETLFADKEIFAQTGEDIKSD